MSKQIGDPKLTTKEQYINELRSWLNKRKARMRSNVGAMTSEGDGELLTGIRSAIRKERKEPHRLSFHFPRHGIFLHYGVGRGYIRQSGRVVRGRNTSRSEQIGAIRSNRRLGDKIEFEHGPIKRKPKDWFDSELEGRPIEKLANIVAEYRGDEMLLNAQRILIGKKK